MRGTIPTLAALVTATAVALAAPAAFAAPNADSKGKAVHKTAQAKNIKAAHKTGRAKSAKVGANTQNCSDEYEYIYAGASMRRHERLARSDREHAARSRHDCSTRFRPGQCDQPELPR